MIPNANTDFSGDRGMQFCVSTMLHSGFKSIPLSLCRHFGIHQEAPEFVEMSVEQEILETGIKVVDLLAPYAKGGKIGMFSLDFASSTRRL